MRGRKYPPGWLVKYAGQAERRAFARGIAFDLTPEDLIHLYDRCAGHCEVTGIPFDMQYRPSGRRRPYAPSIDRIRSDGGYTLENVRIVCVAANGAMNEWGEDVLARLARAYVAKHDGTDESA